MANTPDEREDREGELLTERKQKTQKPRRFQVVLHNDDYTTMEFVVLVLVQFFHRSEAEATTIMMSVHKKGQGVAGIYTRDVAESKVATVMDFAKEHGMPLKLTAEPE